MRCRISIRDDIAAFIFARPSDWVRIDELCEKLHITHSQIRSLLLEGYLKISSDGTSITIKPQSL